MMSGCFSDFFLFRFVDFFGVFFLLLFDCFKSVEDSDHGKVCRQDNLENAGEEDIQVNFDDETEIFFVAEAELDNRVNPKSKNDHVLDAVDKNKGLVSPGIQRSDEEE
jgi:hypothetical protein